MKHQYLREDARAERIWKDEIEIGKSLELEAEKSNTREDYYIIITAKQPVIQEVKNISRDNRT